MAVDISAAIPKPFVMTTGEWEIISPPPGLAAGKLIQLYQALVAEATRRQDAGEPPLTEEEQQVQGWPATLDEVYNLILGPNQVARLREEGIPEAVLNIAYMCALVYWSNGADEAAVQAYLNLVETSLNTDPAPEPAAPKGRKPRRNGHRTA